MASDEKKRVPWFDRLRRVHMGNGQPAEWLAPAEVVARAQVDYLSAMTWFQDAALFDRTHLWSVAPMYLCGRFLQRYRTLLAANQDARTPDIAGVVRADHDVSVRHFSASGARCVVVDRQQHRRLAIYQRASGVRISTQDLGSSVLVYRMEYDLISSRWKIAGIVQELPDSAVTGSIPAQLIAAPALRVPAGRDC